MTRDDVIRMAAEACGEFRLTGATLGITPIRSRDGMFVIQIDDLEERKAA